MLENVAQYQATFIRQNISKIPKIRTHPFLLSFTFMPRNSCFFPFFQEKEKQCLECGLFEHLVRTNFLQSLREQYFSSKEKRCHFYILGLDMVRFSVPVKKWFPGNFLVRFRF
ncbi:hypothetical protein CDAR_169811 [Caerostris darwini]|uniref:Uncharacterized protein n=1 Tax=Caerostris darwini TaxID=1538125 RepID=A0AAV4TTF7_9ARAC|nr:hypothetical protein CDAR_169811 [Caerostris darwini]